MRALLALVVCVAVAEAGALVWLSGRSPAEGLTPGAESLPSVVTHTVYAPSPATTATPTGPIDPLAGHDPAALRQRVAELEEAVREANRATESIAPRLRQQALEVERLRIELAHLRQNRTGTEALPPDPAPGVADAELSEQQLRDRIALLAREALATAWTVGYSIPDGVIPGATEAQRVSAEQLIAEEEPRMLTAVRRFVRTELAESAPPDLDTLSGHELVQRHIGPLMKDGWQQLGKAPLLTHAQLTRGERGLEDVLGADHRSARLARVCANMRRETWGQLERALAPDQASFIKERHLRLGYYRYGTWQLAVGASNTY
jgi:regulator of replication initiation timing